MDKEYGTVSLLHGIYYMIEVLIVAQWLVHNVSHVRRVLPV